MANPGLFSMLGGGDSAAMQSQLDEQRAAQFANQTQEQRLAGMGYKAGAGVGRGLAGAFGVDVQDPTIRRASNLRALAGQYNTNTAAGLRQLADALRTSDPDMALKVSEKAAELDMQDAKMESEKALTAQRSREKQASSIEDKTFIELAKKSTPASVKAAMAANNDIGLLDIPKEVKISTFGQVLKDAGLTEGTPAFQAKMKEFATAEIEGTKNKGTKITNVLPKTAKDITELRKDVQALTKPYQDQSDAAGDAIELADMAIKSNNFAAVASLSRSLAKAAGEAQLSRADVEAFGIDPSLVGRISDTVATLTQGRPTVDTLTKLRQLAEALKKKSDSRIKLEEDTTIEVARASGNYPKEQLETLFRRRSSTAAGGTKTTRSGVTYTVEND